MKTLLVLIIMFLLALIVKLLIDIVGFYLRLLKSEKLNQVIGEKEKDYEFIKGMY
ncbi:MAG: hypothetical protein ACUVRD_08820 [Bacteroidia bacterium]